MSPHIRLVTVALLCAAAVATQSGCSLFVMAGKMFFGNPKVPSAFHQATQVDLSKENARVLVVCTTPYAIKQEMPSLDVDLAEEIGREMERRDVFVTSQRKVADYLADSAGIWGGPEEIAKHFDADYIVQIELDLFQYRDAHSPNVYRGRSNGMVHVFRVDTLDEGLKRVVPVFDSQFNSEWPDHAPVPRERMSARVFRKQYLDRVSRQLAQMLVDYRMSERVE